MRRGCLGEIGSIGCPWRLLSVLTIPLILTASLRAHRITLTNPELLTNSHENLPWVSCLRFGVTRLLWGIGLRQKEDSEYETGEVVRK